MIRGTSLLARGGLAMVSLLAYDAGATTTHVVDDGGTIPYETQAASRWGHDGARGRGRLLSYEIEANATVSVHLNLGPWLNRNGRVYLALPQQSIGVVNVEWSTQGKLLPGTLQSGQRTLVYAGPIRSTVLDDNLTVRVVADGRRVLLPQRLQFHFEIDVD